MIDTAFRTYRIEQMRKTIRAALKNGALEQDGVQSRLAEHFKVSRQRISQIVKQERSKGE